MTDELLVGIAAEQPLRSRMAKVLQRQSIPLVAEAASPDALVDACADRPPHVAVHSWSLSAGAAAIRRLSAGLRRTRIVVVLPSVDRRAVRVALGAGAEGVVVAAQVALTLPVVVRAVWLGQACVPREATSDLDAPVLSHREHDVLALVGAGLNNAEIASRLCVTESTVKSHLSSLFAKLGVHSRMEALAVLRDRPPYPGAGLITAAGSPRAMNGGQA